jgi:E3 ubiquitin-protein ligase RFWD2
MFIFILQVLKKVQRSSTGGKMTAFEGLQHAASQSKGNLTVVQLDALLNQLNTYRREAQQSEKEGSMELLLQFLQHSREDKAKKLQALQRELACLDTDIGRVENTVDGGKDISKGPNSNAGVYIPTGTSHLEQFVAAGDAATTTGAAGGGGTQAMQQAALVTAQQYQLQQQLQAAAALPQRGIHGGTPGATTSKPTTFPTNAAPTTTTTAGQPQLEAALEAAMHRVGPQYTAAAYNALATHPGMATYMATQFVAASAAAAVAAVGRGHGNNNASGAPGSSPSFLLPPPPQPYDTTTPSSTSASQEDYRRESSHMNTRKRRRIVAQFEDLQSAYLRLRADKLKNSTVAVGGGEAHGSDATAPVAEETSAGGDIGNNNGTTTTVGAVVDEGLQEFSRMLSVLSRCNRLTPIAEIPRPSLRQASSIISSVEFDRDGTLFATAGVSKRISVFEHATVVRAPGTLVHCPIIEMVTRSKLSCLTWNRYVASHLASSDYEGVVTVWDVNTSGMVQEYEAHAKRIWSVDYCAADPTLLASGSDDCTVKVWSTRAQASVAQLDLKANVCAVKWRPNTAHQIAVGSADHTVYLYDLRKPDAALASFAGHRKAVSYVRWSGENEIVSASTDSTLRLWDAAGAIASGVGGEAERIYEGHANEKNFVGLAVDGDFLACGSETNEAFVFFKPLSKAVARLRFGDGPLFGGGASGSGGDGAAAAGDDKAFVSAVCWRPGGQELLVADSQGTLRVLKLSGSD